MGSEVETTINGDSSSAVFVFKPCLRGEDFPVLEQVWDNEEDDIYDGK